MIQTTGSTTSTDHTLPSTTNIRRMCVIFGGIALSAAVFGVLTNEFDAIKQTERPFWWMLLGTYASACVCAGHVYVRACACRWGLIPRVVTPLAALWGITSLFFMRPVFNHLCLTVADTAEVRQQLLLAMKPHVVSPPPPPPSPLLAFISRVPSVPQPASSAWRYFAITFCVLHDCRRGRGEAEAEAATSVVPTNTVARSRSSTTIPVVRYDVVCQDAGACKQVQL
eukprot:COSAG05_NODE_1801_length_4060_cov_2.209291_1_plen_226_part_00